VAQAWRSLSERARRAWISYPTALLLHGLILLALVSLPAARQLGLGPSLEQGGRPGAHNGQTFSFVLVSATRGADLGPQTRERAPTDRDARQGDQGQALIQVPTRTDVLAFAAGAPNASGDSFKPSPAPQDQAAASPAASSQGEVVQSAVQSGDLEGAQNLLRQIARCLPPDKRPVISGAKLAVRLDAAGVLTAAPDLDLSTAVASKEAIAEANLVIQAALQCGPYQAPGALDYALAADFSFLEPGPRRPMDARHGR
jgi:hypothetical protein